MARSAFKNGFTLTEMLVVTVLISLLAGAAAGIYGGTFKRMAVEKCSKELLLAAKYARMTAVEEQNWAVLNLDQANGAFFVSIVSTDEETGERKEVPVTNPYSKPVRLPEGVAFANIRISSGIENEYAPSGESKIWFNADGTCDSAVVQVGDGRNFATISISGATGKARLMMDRIDDPNTDVIDLDFK